MLHTSLGLNEGGTSETLLIRLGTQPTANVTVALSGGTDANGTGVTCSGTHKLCIDSPKGGTKSNTSLTFTTQNWDTHQSIELTGQTDTDQTNESLTLTLTPSGTGSGYSSTEAATVSVTIYDDDKNTLVFTGLTDGGIEVDEGTSTSTFTVALSANPASAVTVALTSSNAAVSVSPTSLSFSTTAGTTAQTVTITAGSDPNTVDETYYLRLTPSGSDDDTTTRGATVAVTVDDADTTSDLTVSETSLSLNESSTGNTDTFTVKLATAPAAGQDVTVAIGVHGANGKRIATADKNKLTFTSSTYNTAQTVTITGVVDKDAANETGTVRVTASQDGPFSGLSRSIPITVTDNSKDDGIVVTRNDKALSSVTSGQGTVTAYVRLPFAPTGNVSVSASPSSGNVTAKFGSNSSATFTSQNWDVAQALTITVGSGSVADGGVTVTLSATGYTSKTFKVFGDVPPTATISGGDNAITVTFSKAVGACTKATEAYCSGTVTAFTSTTIDDVFELVVGSADDNDTEAGDAVTFTATISGTVATISPTVPTGARTLNLLVKDRYWSVNGGVQGGTVLQRLNVENNRLVLPSTTTNTAPTIANAIADQTVAVGGYVDVPLAGVFSDADGEGLAHAAWSSDRSVATVQVNSSRVRVTGVKAGTATISVRAIDASNAFVTDSFTVTVGGSAQATATLYNADDPSNSQYVTVQIDSSKAFGAAGNAWTLVPVQQTDSTQGLLVTADDSAKELRIRLTGNHPDDLVNAINAKSGFTVVRRAGTWSWKWWVGQDADKYSDVPFSGGVSAGNSPSRTLGLGAASAPPAPPASSPEATPAAHDPVGRLENPSVTSFQSGVGLLSGWACEADQVNLVLNPGTDEAQTLEAAYGTDRADTETVCGDTNNGFGLLFNWNLLGDGPHTIVAQADGEEFGRATVTVTTLGEEFVRGAEGECTVPDFPEPGDTTRLVWQEAQQNFVIAAGERPTGTTQAGTEGEGRLENPSANSYQSGIGLISGWVCDAERVAVRLNGQTLTAAYGTARADTAEACGDTDNGFGLLFNWNLLGDGEHEVEALADGAVFGRTRVRVTTLGAEFVREVAGSCTAEGFPSASESVTLEWQESRQNFGITEVR